MSPRGEYLRLDCKEKLGVGCGKLTKGETMKLRRALLLVAAVLAFCLAGAAISQTAEETLLGSYFWKQSNERGDLRAVFTPKGEGKYDVVFHFDFRGPHTYTGTAEGSLKEGSLKGTVQNENKKRTWNFAGTFTNGQFEGTHEELRDGDKIDSGTLTLKR